MSGRKGLFLAIGAVAGFVAGKDAKEKLMEVKENPKDVLHETFNGFKEKIISIKDEIVEDNNIEIAEEDILISRNFEEGDM